MRDETTQRISRHSFSISMGRKGEGWDLWLGLNKLKKSAVVGRRRENRRIGIDGLIGRKFMNASWTIH